MRANFILQLCDFSGGRAISLSAVPKKQAEYSVSVSWIGHGLGHGAQAAFLGKIKQKPRPGQPTNKGWQGGYTLLANFHLL